MPSVGIQEFDYKIHCLEKENERLIESVKQTRQNALALVAAVLFITSGVLNIAKPVVSDLRNSEYEGELQNWLVGEPKSAERIIAVGRVTCLWNVALLGTVFSTALAIGCGVYIFTKSGSYVPRLNKDVIDSMSRDNYKEMLLNQHNGLTKLNHRYRYPLICGAISLLVAASACGILMLLWLGLGNASLVV